MGTAASYSDSDLSLNRGNIWGIVGQNGTGKKYAYQNMHGTGHPRFRPRGLAAGHYHWLSLDQYACTNHVLTMEQFLKSSFRSLYELEAAK